MDINQRIEIADENLTNAEFMPNPTVIKVVGVGNGGCNAVNRMIEEGLAGVSFIAMNTDAQQLSRSKANVKVVLGKEITGGLGAGTDPEKGAEAARRDEKKIASMLEGADLVFVASGFGGGTGTGASPIIAAIAKASGALTIGVVTKPFEMEGKLKMSRAEKGIEQMSGGVDSLIVIPNENLNSMFEEDITFEDSFKVVDDILRQAVQGISDIITETGFGLNVDFADVQTMIKNSDGIAHLGIGYGKGEARIDKAVTNAFNNPLLDVENIRNASGILANIVCPKDFSLREHKEAMKIISHYASDNANIKVGVCQKDDMVDEIRTTIIATGFEHGKIYDSSSNTNNRDDDSNNKLEPKSTEKPSSDIKPSSTNKGDSDSMVTRSLNNTKQLLEKEKEKPAEPVISVKLEPVTEPKPIVEPKPVVEEKVEAKVEPIAQAKPIIEPKPEPAVEVKPAVEPTVAPVTNTATVETKPVEPVQAVQPVQPQPNNVQETVLQPNVANSIQQPQQNVVNTPNIENRINVLNASNNSINSNNNNLEEKQIEKMELNYMEKRQDQDIQEAINIANSIKNSPVNRNYDNDNNSNNANYNDGYVQASTQSMTNNTNNTMLNNTQNSRANSDHVMVEQSSQNMYNGNNANNNNNSNSSNNSSNYRDNAEPELLSEKDSEYVYESAKTISPHSGQEYVENPHYGIDGMLDQEEHQIYDDTDIDTPAFLRRIIQTKK